MGHLYSLAGNGQYVLPFSFLVNLMMFTITNSKLALSIVSKLLPGGSYYAVTSWRDSLESVPQLFPSSDCITAFDNDQIVQRKWKVKVGQKARVSILTSMSQTVIDQDGTLQQREEQQPEEAIIEGCAYIYRIYLQSKYTVCIPDKISICSNRGRIESLGNDEVSSLKTRMESLGYDGVSLQNARKYLVGNDCDVTITGGSSK